LRGGRRGQVYTEGAYFLGASGLGLGFFKTNPAIPAGIQDLGRDTPAGSEFLSLTWRWI